ncbi:MAG: hypothetical protein Q9186_003344 [Xanthomendoza sp. 1 TL-2023]
MCNIVVALLDCGHERFLRVHLLCPAGFCLEHQECFADRTRTTRTVTVHSPPYCRACFDQKIKDVVNDFVSAMDDLFINHQPVRRYYRARYGSQATHEDRDRIVARLRKIRDVRKEEVRLEFFGPSGQIPQGRYTFLYQLLEQSYPSHEECIQAFRIADNWNSSDESLAETGLEDNSQYISPENTMRQWYGGIQQNAVQSSRPTSYSSSETSESGEYFREQYRQWRGEDPSLRRAIEALPGSDPNNLLHPEDQLDVDSQTSSESGTDGTDSVANISTDTDGHSTQGSQELSEQIRTRLRARLDELDAEVNAPTSPEDQQLHVDSQTRWSGTDATDSVTRAADIPTDTESHSTQGSQEHSEQIRTRLRARLDGLDTEINAAASPCSSMIEDSDPQTPAPITDIPQQSHFNDITDHNTNENPPSIISSTPGSEREDSALQQREGLRNMIRRTLRRIISFGTI